MNKGINTLINETRVNITNAINEGLKAGLPIAVVDLIVDNAMIEIKQLLNKKLEEENVKVQEENAVLEQQIPYTEDSK